MKKKNKTSKVSAPHFHSYDDSSWITNFWFIDDQLFLTDSVFSARKNMLASINPDEIMYNLKAKRVIRKKFLSHPNPINGSIVESSNTDVNLIDYYDDFVYNVFKYNGLIYVSFIKNDKNSYVISIDEKGNQKLEDKFNNYLVIGELYNRLVLKSVETRKTFINNKETRIHSIKKIVYTDQYYIVQSDLNHLYKISKMDKSIEIIKDDVEEVNISNFDNQTYVISDKQEKLTYIINNSGQIENIDSNYYYRLDCYKKMLLVGKPLFTSWEAESYTLPLTFID